MLKADIKERIGNFGPMSVWRVEKTGTHPCRCMGCRKSIKPGDSFFMIVSHGAAKDHSNFCHSCFYKLGGKMRKVTSKAQRKKDIIEAVVEAL